MIIEMKSSTNRDVLVIFEEGNFAAGLECTGVILTIKISSLTFWGFVVFISNSSTENLRVLVM